MVTYFLSIAIQKRSHLISLTNRLLARHCANTAPIAVAYLHIYYGQMHRAPKRRLNRSSVVGRPAKQTREWDATVDPRRSRYRFVALMRLKSLFSMTFGRERSKRWALSRIGSAPGVRREEPGHSDPRVEIELRERAVQMSFAPEIAAGAEDSTRNPRDQLIPAASRAVRRESPRRAARDPSRRADRCRGGTERCRRASPRP